MSSCENPARNSIVYPISRFSWPPTNIIQTQNFTVRERNYTKFVYYASPTSYNSLYTGGGGSRCFFLLIPPVYFRYILLKISRTGSS